MMGRADAPEVAQDSKYLARLSPTFGATVPQDRKSRKALLAQRCPRTESPGTAVPQDKNKLGTATQHNKYNKGNEHQHLPRNKTHTKHTNGMESLKKTPNSAKPRINKNRNVLCTDCIQRTTNSCTGTKLNVPDAH